MAEQYIPVDNLENVITAFGSLDENLHNIEASFDVSIAMRDSNIHISGEGAQIDKAARVIRILLDIAARHETIDRQKVSYLIDLADRGNDSHYEELLKDVICVTAKGKPIKAKTMGQHKYMDAIKKNTICIAVGPAGTGKTYLAVAQAVSALRQKQISRIILTRPAVEAGERLGFLPGDLQSKVDPYLRPLNDALFEMLGPDSYARHLERGEIEIAPLAYMRGRTLDESFIILDEAQNTTREQMKMFLTRLGFGSRMVITGDVTQIDLPKDQTSGLKDAVAVLKNVEDIAVVSLSAADVVRHELVQRIVNAYETYEHNRAKKESFAQGKYKIKNRK